MRILAYRAKDFKGVRDVAIDSPDPALVIVAGNNGSGKTSVLDGIFAALCGKAASPAEPVRRGADRAEVRVDLGEYRVTRRWYGKGQSKLYVDRADGTGCASPQAALDALVGAVAFDPLAFAGAKPDEQARTLRKLAGLEEELARIDAARQAAYDERTDVNRAVRQEEAAPAGFPPEEEFAGLPDEPPDAAALLDGLKAAQDEWAYNEAVRRDARDAERALNNRLRETDRARRDVEAARAALERAELLMAESVRDEADARDTYQKAVEGVAGLADPDLDLIRFRIRTAEGVRHKVRRRDERRAAADRLAWLRAEAGRLTGVVEGLAAERGARLAAAPLPVPGLALAGDVVTLGGVPLAQASAAERLRAGLAVGLALNPTLRVALLRDGSLLDDASMRVVEGWARREDFQVWVERVGPASDPRAVVIEEGRVAPRAGPAAGEDAPGPAWPPPDDALPW